MKPRILVWLAVCGALILALSATGLPGLFLGAVVAAALVLGILLSVKRYRLEWDIVRTLWRAVTTRPRLE